jgi:hypothetical protein
MSEENHATMPLDITPRTMWKASRMLDSTSQVAIINRNVAMTAAGLRLGRASLAASPVCRDDSEGSEHAGPWNISSGVSVSH